VCLPLDSELLAFRANYLHHVDIALAEEDNLAR
jgi:hypothetical protein